MYNVLTGVIASLETLLGLEPALIEPLELAAGRGNSAGAVTNDRG